jgi:HCOMODA/2-hydroxy-3-carboxy-muconic semialdehyde decarboxylase
MMPVSGVVADDICTAGEMLVKAGFSKGFGHVSARTAQGFVITPRRRLGGLRGQDLVRADELGRALSSSSPEGAPSETLLHAAIYRWRPDVGAVVRAQPPYAEAFGVAGLAIRPVHDFGATLLSAIEVFDDPRLINSPEMAAAVADALGGATAIVLRGNGCLTVGRDVRDAMVKMLWLEESAEIQHRALALAAATTSAEVRYFSDLEVDEMGTLLGRPDRIERRWLASVAELGLDR